MVIGISAFSQVNQLEPCSEPYYEQDFEYNHTMDSILFENLSPDFMIRYLVKPAFDKEYGFQITKNPTNDTYVLSRFIFSENLWYAPNYDTVSMTVNSVEIPTASVDNIDYLFSHFTEPEHIAHDKVITCTDGKVCRFIRATGDSTTCGEQHSPKKNTLINDFAVLCDYLSTSQNIDTDNIKEMITNIEKQLDI